VRPRFLTDALEAAPQELPGFGIVRAQLDGSSETPEGLLGFPLIESLAAEIAPGPVPVIPTWSALPNEAVRDSWHRLPSID
jgi:hypothetical protein